ncbi:unnamed protein product [Closterium sp. Yama58-4]|nr:unnamed protein product [Closterium sp. Yama58-4]
MDRYINCFRRGGDGAEPVKVTGAAASVEESSEDQGNAPPVPKLMVGFPWIREFSYKELHNATKGFKNIIGEGGFAKVCRGRVMLPAGDGATREIEVAVKVMRVEPFTDEKLKAFEAEVAAIPQVKHANILSLEGIAISKEQRPLFVYEYIPGGDVKSLLQQVRRNEDQFPWKERVKVALGCAEALAFIHEKGLMHRDFRSSNVLLREDRTPIVADFELAPFIEEWSWSPGYLTLAAKLSLKS